MNPRLRYLLALLLVALVQTSLWAQPADSVDAGPSTTANVEPESDTEALRVDEESARAQMVLTTGRIKDLLAKRLDPSVEAESLFEVSPDDKGPYGFEALLQYVNNPRKRVEKPREESEGNRVERQLFEARLSFLRLPQSKRNQLLSAHQSRRATALEKAQATSDELGRLQKIRDELTAMFQGKGPGSSRDALTINALSENDVVLSADRRKAFLGEKVEDQNKLQTLRQEIDGLRKRFWEADSDARALLLDPPPPPEVVEAPVAVEEVKKIEPDQAALERQRKAESEAARAERERQEAIESARTARTESLRLIASEKARLLGIKASHAELESKFIAEEKTVEASTENALLAARQVRELQQRSVLDGNKEADANKLYDDIIKQLRDVRAQLGEVLNEIQSGDSRVATTGPLPDVPEQINVPELADLERVHSETRTSEETLKAREITLRWARATALRDAMVTVNDSRLQLLKSVTSAKRDQLTGFGAPGVAQVVREFEQISLATRYHILALPRLLTTQEDVFIASPIVLVWLLIKFIFLTSLFVWWRRRADKEITKLLHFWRAKRPQDDWTRRIITALWYLKRIRVPLEWLIFLWALSGGNEFDTWPEIEFAKIVLLWALLGSFVIQLVDAIAEHQGDQIEGTSTDALRVKSLRLVGVTIVVVGLTLSVAEASVGQGAIYGWVRSTSWLFAIPIAILLVIWWRPIVFERAGRIEHPNPFITWVNSHQNKVAGYFSAAAGGVYLLSEGLFRWVYVQVSDLTITRRFLAYLFRREVEKQASKTTSHVLDRKVSAEIYDKFEPYLEDDVIIAEYMRKTVAEAAAWLSAATGTVVAIVGERGLGKTTFLERATQDMATGTHLYIVCDFGGFPSLINKLKYAVDLSEEASIQELHAALAKSPFLAISLDDTHRLIRPVIGGLKDFDALLELIRGASQAIGWSLSIEAPAWQYLRRARAGQALFDHVVLLERWEEEQIAAFVQARCTAVGINPNFEHVVVPSQSGSNTRTLDQTRTDYFRILWDYSRGNPALAMQYWRESLWTRDGSDDISVRLYRPPAASALSDIPPTHHFVLRTLVQLELCDFDDVVACTGLKPTEVLDAIRLGTHRDYIEMDGDKMGIRLGWYRAVADLLTRQHLLSLGGA